MHLEITSRLKCNNQSRLYSTTVGTVSIVHQLEANDTSGVASPEYWEEAHKGSKADTLRPLDVTEMFVTEKEERPCASSFRRDGK